MFSYFLQIFLLYYTLVVVVVVVLFNREIYGLLFGPVGLSQGVNSLFPGTCLISVSVSQLIQHFPSPWTLLLIFWISFFSTENAVVNTLINIAISASVLISEE